MKTGFFTDEKTFWHIGGVQSLVLPVGGWVQPPSAAGFAESPDSKRRFLSLLQVSGLAAKLDMRSAAPASRADLLRIHPAGYLDEFKRISDTTGGNLGVGAPFGVGSYEIAALSAGLAMAAIDAVVSGGLKNAFSLSRPPGHHCLPDTPMGFCLLANIPVAIEAARAKHGVGRVAVVDWDVHHGNGTQTIYYEDPDTLTISLHQDRCFPPGYSGGEDRGAGKGEGTNINIPLLPGGGHAPIHDALAVASLIRPEVITTSFLHVDVETAGTLTVGRTVIDTQVRTEAFKRKAPNCHVAFGADRALFRSLLTEAFARTA